MALGESREPLRRSRPTVSTLSTARAWSTGLRMHMEGELWTLDEERIMYQAERRARRTVGQELPLVPRGTGQGDDRSA